MRGHVVLSLFAVLALCTAPAAVAGPPMLPELSLEPVVSGLEQPVSITHAGDDRLFVTLRIGQVVVVRSGQVLSRPFLDLVPQVGADGFEQGLLSVAFHPQYADNGLFFVNYTDLQGDTVISRFRRSPSDANLADPASEQVLVRIAQPRANHNGGQLQFGPNGLLWVGMGDGGGANDPSCTAQDDTRQLGKMLRIDVDADPPEVSTWAKGLRNPWRFSFDRLTSDLFISDVGQDLREEISWLPAGTPPGSNLGWSALEGTVCRGANGCPGVNPPCDDPSLTGPILEYVNDGTDCAVVGGYVYRGREIPGLEGIYLFGDFCSGLLRFGIPDGDGAWDLVPVDLPPVPNLTSFGQDVHGELYAATLDGNLLRLAAAPEVGSCTPSNHALCLTGGRFKVEAFWDTETQRQPATAQPLTTDTGYFWFFDQQNVEVVVKVLDACGPFGRFWVFSTGLTDVGVTVRVTDTETGQVKRYRTRVEEPYTPRFDVAGFDTCP